MCSFIIVDRSPWIWEITIVEEGPCGDWLFVSVVVVYPVVPVVVSIVRSSAAAAVVVVSTVASHSGKMSSAIRVRWLRHVFALFAADG